MVSWSVVLLLIVHSLGCAAYVPFLVLPALGGKALKAPVDFVFSLKEAQVRAAKPPKPPVAPAVHPYRSRDGADAAAAALRRSPWWFSNM